MKKEGLTNIEQGEAGSFGFRSELDIWTAQGYGIADSREEQNSQVSQKDETDSGFMGERESF